MTAHALSARRLRRASVLAGAAAALALLAAPATAEEADGDEADDGEDPEIETTYQVAEGDHLVAIAEEHDLDSWVVLYAVNHEDIDHPDVILIGQELDIPASPDQVDVDAVDIPSDTSLPEPDGDEGSAGAASEEAQPTSGSSHSSHGSQSASAGVWDRLAECESNGDWSANGGRFSGGLQFHPQTWAAHGGQEFAPTAAQASRGQEIAVAERVLASQGWSAWPACSSELGLR